VGLHQVWAAHNFKIYSPELFMTSGGLGAMGLGLGAAIGAQLASNRPSLLITGDGSFNMNFNELTTAIKNHIPVIIVVMNNKSLGMIRKLQLARGRQTPASSLYLDTDYVRLAQALGARGARISESDEILPSLHNALNGTLPVVIDCEIGINTGI
jgi:acetolactate synthase-1/2/3 large subunit